jgi:hypothetical protein
MPRRSHSATDLERSDNCPDLTPGFMEGRGEAANTGAVSAVRVDGRVSLAQHRMQPAHTKQAAHPGES